MTDRQNDKLNMHIEVLDFCKASESEWEHIPIFGHYVCELETHVNNAGEIVKRQQGVPVKGTTAQKSNAEDVLVQECLTVGGVLYAYGLDSGNPVLIETGRVNKHTLYKQHGHLTLAKAQNIAEAAADNSEQMADYGIGEAEYDTLTEAIAAYKALIVLPREAISERKQYTGSLAKELAAADSVLHDKMDKIVARFKHSNPRFYDAYKNARAVKGGQSTRHRPKETVPPETEQPTNNQ